MGVECLIFCLLQVWNFLFKIALIMRFALVAGCVLLLTISCQANKYSKRQGIPDLVAVAGEDCTQFCDLACNNQCFEGDDCFKEDCECGCDTFCGRNPNTESPLCCGLKHITSREHTAFSACTHLPWD